MRNNFKEYQMSNAREMRRLTMTIELEYDVKTMHGYDEQAKDWFFNEILSGVKGELSLHSNDIGDFIGVVKVLEIIGEQPSATVKFFDIQVSRIDIIGQNGGDGLHYDV
jgi:hypothetical protein